MLLRKTCHVVMIALLCGLPACIPSKSETEKPARAKESPATKAPEAAPVVATTATPNSAPASVSSTQEAPAMKKAEGTSSVSIPLTDISAIPTAEEFDENDPAAVVKKNQELAANNGGVMLYTDDDGVGFKVEGPNGFTATLKPDPSGESWIFDGAFAAKTEGLKVGKEQVTSIIDGNPFGGQEKSTVKGLYMIVIPVQLPDINAIETGDTYKTPVHFTVKASADSQFLVNTMPVKNL